MVNTVITMETEIVRTVTFMAQYAFKKHRVSCYNLFLLGKAKPARYLTLQEDHNVSIYDLFLFCANWAQIWKSASRPPKKVKFQVCSYQSFTDNKTLSGHTKYMNFLWST